MTKKKSAFWTFIFSMMPGAAEMYMGFMKMGISLMSLFIGIFVLSTYFQQGIFVVIDVVVWFYGFFHAHNLRAMDDEDFYALEDDYLFHLDDSGKEFWTKAMVSRYRALIAAALILIGASILFDNLLGLLQWLLPDAWVSFLNGLGYRMPQMILAVCIILAGVWMIRGKKQELQEEEEEYTDEDTDEDANEDTDEDEEELNNGRETDSQNP